MLPVALGRSQNPPRCFTAGAANPKDEEHLTGADYLPVMEVLDCYIRAGRNPSPHERHDYRDFQMLRPGWRA